MDKEHTPEPWRYSEVIGGCWVYAGDREVLAYKHSPDHEGKANARRIVACVNACEGISTDEIEQGRIALIRSGSQGNIKAEHDRLAALNRELVEALEFNAKELENLCKRGNGSWSASRIKADCEGLAEHARAVLAKVKS